MSSRHAPKPSAPKPTLKQRAAVARDAAGRFIKRQKQAEPHSTSGPTAEPKVPLGKIPVRSDSHPDTYGLRIDDAGLGRHAAPGASVIVEPTMPEGAGLAVFYLKGRSGPIIFDLTHHFDPEHARPYAPGSEVTPMIGVCEPISGIPRLIDAAQVEKIHRVTGIYAPAEIMDRWKPAPEKLPLMAACPEGMGEHYVKDTACYPTVRPSETVVYDPAQREPTDGALCVLEWSNGRRSLLMTNLRPSGGKGELRWWVDPVNRPISREALERRLADSSPGDMLHTSDGPFTEDHLRERIVGTVVGILVPQRAYDRDEASRTTMPLALAPSSPGPSRRSGWTMAALIDAGLTSKISSEIRGAIEDHAEAIAAGEAEADDSDEAFDKHALRQSETDTALRRASARSLADLRAKLLYLTPVMAPDMADQTHVAHLEAICGDLDWLCRERPPLLGSGADTELLRLGERLDRAHAHWRRMERQSREPQELYRSHTSKAMARGIPAGEAHEAGLSLPGVQEAIDAEAEAFDTVVSISEEIWKLPHRTVAGLAVKARAALVDHFGGGRYEERAALGEDEDFPDKGIRRLIEACCALAGVDWRGDPIAPRVPDPVLAVIERHVAARAACVGLHDGEDPEGYEAAQDRRISALKAVESTRPQTVDGLIALARHVDAYRTEDNLGDDYLDGSDNDRAFGALIEACLNVPAQATMAASRDWEGRAALHPGTMPFPQKCPVALLALEYAIPQEAAHLLELARAEFERRQEAYSGHHDATLWPRIAAQLRADMRIDALTIAAAPPRSIAAADADPIMEAIQTHQAARDAFEGTVNPQDKAWVRANGGDVCPEAMAAADAAYATACETERKAWVVLFEVRPTTFPGLLALTQHLQQFGPSNDGLEGGPTLWGMFGAIAAGLARLIGAPAAE